MKRKTEIPKDAYIPFKAPAEVNEYLKREAKRLGMDRSALIRRIIRFYKERKPTAWED